MNTADLEEFFGDFDWPSRCAWLKPDSPAKQLEIDLMRATQELKKLYSPALCRELATTEHRRLYYSLFIDGWFDGVAGVLLLGHDLAEAVGWENAKDLAGRLRDIEEFE